MTSPIPVDSLIQGGLSGIAVGLIVLLYLRGKAHDAMMDKQLRAHDLIIGNHMSKTDNLIMENTKAMAKIGGSIDKNTISTEHSTEVSKRIENILDRR